MVEFIKDFIDKEIIESIISFISPKIAVILFSSVRAKK